MAIYSERHKQVDSKRQKEYDMTVRYTRDIQFTSFYNSPDWERKRAYIISKYHGIDVYIYYSKQSIVSADMVHHIEPLRDAWNLRWDDDNLIPLSSKSHGDIEYKYRLQKTATQTMLKDFVERWKTEFKG